MDYTILHAGTFGMAIVPMLNDYDAAAWAARLAARARRDGRWRRALADSRAEWAGANAAAYHGAARLPKRPGARCPNCWRLAPARSAPRSAAILA